MNREEETKALFGYPAKRKSIPRYETRHMIGIKDCFFTLIQLYITTQITPSCVVGWLMSMQEEDVKTSRVSVTRLF